MARCYASALVYSVITMLLLDYFYLKHIGGPSFNSLVQTIQKTPMEINKTYAVITYVLLLIGLLTLSIPRVRQDSIVKDSLLYGGLLGLVIYGVFDFTNLTIFKDYNINTALQDTAWGSFLMAITTLVGAWVSYNQKWFVK